MRYIKIIFRDETETVFRVDDAFSNPSASLSMKFEPGFVVITDEHQSKTCFPTDLIKQIGTSVDRRL